MTIRSPLILLLVSMCFGSASAQMLVVSGGADAVLDRPVASIQLRETPARDALQWLADAAGLGLVVNWDRLAEYGIDAEHPVTMSLRGVSLRVVLRLVLADIFDSDEIVVEITPQYLRVLTRQQAGNEPVIKVYDVGDILHEVPNFTGPELDIGSAAGGAGSTGVGFQEGETDNAETLNRNDRGQQLADQIRNSIEPDIWEENGGTMGRITYYEGRLIIRAPEYVHQQIGMANGPIRQPAAPTPSNPPAGPMTSGYSTTTYSPAPMTATPTAAQIPTRTYQPWTYRPRTDYGTVPVSGIDWSQAK